jgi:hypothetical protein
MVRGLQVALVLGLTGFMLGLFPGPLGEHRPGEAGESARVAHPAAVAPKVASGDDAGPSPLAEFPQPGSEPNRPGETWSATVREPSGRSPRLPAQIVNLVKRQNLAGVIEKYARRYGVDEDLVWAVIRQESGFNPDAVSPKGAMGLMQLMPGTAALMGVSDALDVEQNIAGGIKYLERCLSQFNQDVCLALAAYNAGSENVVKYQGCPPFPETQHYVATILQAYAGQTIRKDFELISLSPAVDGDALDTPRRGGLAWRLPRPQFRIATPQCKLGSPRWKATLPPF